MSRLESLAPKRRFSIDSNKSPACATAASRALPATSAPGLCSSTKKLVTYPTNAAATMPPPRPLQVFFGLILGASFGPPKARPATNAPMSVAQTAATSQRTIARPVLGSLRNQIRARHDKPMVATPRASHVASRSDRRPASATAKVPTATSQPPIAARSRATARLAAPTLPTKSCITSDVLAAPHSLAHSQPMAQAAPAITMSLYGGPT